MTSIATVDHLEKRYGSHVAVEDVSFSVEKGEIFGILGPNRSGKTTTVECLQGLRRADGGALQVLGLDPLRHATELRHHIGSQLQESALPERIKVWEALAFFWSLTPDRRRRLLAGRSDHHGTTVPQPPSFILTVEFLLSSSQQEYNGKEAVMKLRVLLHRPVAKFLVAGTVLLLGLPACGPNEPNGTVATTRTTTTGPEPITMTPPVQNPAQPAVPASPPVPDPPPPDLVTHSLLTVTYGPDSAHRIDIHRPATPNGLAVLWLHSGGWKKGTRTETGPVVERLCEQGTTVFSADYRLTPAHVFPAQIHDVKRAIRYVKAHRAEFPFETLVVAGGSSGGHLAALAATSAGDLEPTDLPPELAEQDSTVDGAISLSGIMDLTRFWAADHGWAKPLSDAFLDCDSATCDQTVMRQASPTFWVDVNDPPLFLVAGAGDTLVTPADNADRMWAAMEQDGAPGRCWYDLLEHAGHNLYEDFDPVRVEQFLIHFGLLDLPTVPPDV